MKSEKNAAPPALGANGGAKIQGDLMVPPACVNVKNAVAESSNAEVEQDDLAAVYAASGFAFFPCRLDKAPAIKNWQTRATSDPEEIRALIDKASRDEIMLGLVIPLGVIAIDIDSGDALAALRESAPHGWSPGMEKAPIQRTGRGVHVLYRLPACAFWGALGTGSKGLPKGVDIRANGKGYLIVGPSLHVATGRRYVWKSPLKPISEIPLLPDWLQSLLLPTGSPKVERREESALGGDAARLSKATERCAGKVRIAKDGERNEGLNIAAFTIAGIAAAEGLPLDDARERLAAAALEAGLEPGETQKTIESGFSAGAEKPLVKSSWPCTDLGNAERLVAFAGDKIRYCPPRKKWIIWDGARWFWDDSDGIIEIAKKVIRGIYEEAARCEDSEIRKAISSHAKRSESAPRIAAMIALAKSDPKIVVMPDALDNDAHLLGCPNGVLNLETCELMALRQEFLITKSVACDYDPGARSPLWEAALDTWTGGDKELANYLQKLAGYSLFGTVPEKVFHFAFGPPNGGKSRFLGALRDVLGDYAANADFSTWLVQPNSGGNRGDLTRLMGARLVVSDEARRGARFDESLMKLISCGGGRITRAAKYEAETEFEIRFTLILAANDCPVIRDDDEGSWSRVRRVPFTHVIPENERDPEFQKKLASPSVQKAILSWAVQGFAAWRRNGLGSCSAIEHSGETYHQEMDRFAGFLEECCTLGSGGRVEKSELWSAYQNWASEEGASPLHRKDFNLRIKNLGCVASKKNRQKAWAGISLKTDSLNLGGFSVINDLEAEEGY
jgi:P4 family phage/plasmid primase-like protien